MADKAIDPFDVAALEKSLNDSATRVSTIWVSFLIFSLYLLTAAATVTHRQLLLAEPVKLPVLNIDLPLVGFFFLAPILFVILHAYVLIQVILLSRTAAAYSAAVARVAERDNLTPEENASLRQRLANTLFAQIFAGSPREREGAFGWLLRAMAWLTLAVSPILILLTFQFTFLPYHCHGVTWTHRLLILLEFVVAFQHWPLVLDPQRDVHWPQWQAGARPAREHMRSMLRSPEPALRVGRALRRRAAPLGVSLILAFLALWLASFPGEWHVNVATGRPINAVQCERLLHQDFRMVDLRVDRLNVQRADVVDDEKLEKIEKATERNGEQPYQGERTRLLRGRDLNCGDFSDFADLRRVDLSGAQLRGANLERAKLQGSSLASAVLSQASLKRAQLRGALLDRAELQGAFLAGAQLQGASLENAKLQGAFLNENPQLQGASLNGAELQGASLVGAELQGASLNRAKLQGAFLFLTDLQGASLDDAELQGASFTDVQLQAASLNGAKLHGARLGRANLTHAVLSRSWIWRADNAACTNARVIDPKLDALSGDDAEKPTPARPEQVRKLIAGWMSGMPDGARRDTRSRRLLERLTVDPDKDDTAAIADAWLQCAKASSTIPEKDFHAARTTLLRNLVCDDPENGPTIGAGITATLRRLLPSFRAKVASALLGEDGRECAVAKSYDEPTRKELRRLPRPAQPFASPK